MKPGYNLDPDELHQLRRWPLDQPRRATGLWLERAPERESPELALGIWTVVSLLGLALGLGIAKYAQAWAQDVYHPAAIWGGLVVLVSLALVVVAALRYQRRVVGLPVTVSASRTLSTLSVLLVLVLAWAALSMICLAGWELPWNRAA